MTLLWLHVTRSTQPHLIVPDLAKGSFGGSGEYNYNQSQKLLRLTMFSWKSPKQMLDLLEDTQNSSSPWLNVVPRLEKLCQAVVVRNDQTNLQPILNKGKSVQVYFWDRFSPKLKKCWKEFYKDWFTNCAFTECVTIGYHMRYHVCYHTFMEIWLHFY